MFPRDHQVHGCEFCWSTEQQRAASITGAAQGSHIPVPGTRHLSGSQAEMCDASFPLCQVEMGHRMLQAKFNLQ